MEKNCDGEIFREVPSLIQKQPKTRDECRNIATRRSPKPRVCRKLFSDVKSSNEEMPNKEIRIISQENVKKWNFNFDEELPLVGDWLWEKVK